MYVVPYKGEGFCRSSKGLRLRSSFWWRFSCLLQSTLVRMWSGTPRWAGRPSRLPHAATMPPVLVSLPALPAMRTQAPAWISATMLPRKNGAFRTLKKKINKLVLKYAPWLGSLYCCFFLISFSLPAPKSYLPEREAPLFFPSSLWMSVLKWLKCLHCVQFWHRCSAFFF